MTSHIQVNKQLIRFKDVMIYELVCPFVLLFGHGVVLPRFTDSDNPFNISKLLLWMYVDRVG